MKFKKLTIAPILITILAAAVSGIFLLKSQPEGVEAALQLNCSIETIDNLDMTGEETSLALDTNGNPYIGYMSYDQLKRAKWTGSSWSLKSISNGSIGCGGCIGLDALVDSNDKSFITFQTCTYNGVGMTDINEYFGAYDVYMVDSGDNIGFIIGGAMIPTGTYEDTLGKYQVSYYDYNNSRLRHAKWNISYGSYSWTRTTVDTLGFSPSAMALDSSNYAGIAYADIDNYILKYAKWTGSSWSKQTVDTVGNNGLCSDTPSIWFDSNNYPQISYTPGSLRYAKWTGSNWSKTTVDSVNSQYSSIALGPYNSARRCASGNCYPYISYYDASNKDLKLAVFNGSSWDKYTVDSTGDVGRMASIARDAADNIHISYYDQTNGKLKYAKCSLGAANQPPTISSATNSPDPVTIGNNVAFEANWSDPDSGDQTKLHICKTNAISGQTCSGGSWCDTAAWSTASPSSCNYTPTASDVGTQNYYAFVCDDDNACSTSISGTFTVQSAITAPTVTNSTGASNVTATSARLNGEVTSTGGENPTVHIYWGDNDGGTTPSNWDYQAVLPDSPSQPQGTGTFYKDISGLNPSTTYYYRAYATNSGGSDWADSTSSFTTEAEAPPPVNSVWQSCHTTTPACGYGWNYSMGYKFTPNQNGQITHLCGYFSGTKTIKLYSSSYSVLASTSVTSSNAWSCSPITPVDVASGSTYYVIAEMAGSGGCYQSDANLPKTCGDLTIQATVYQSPSGTFNSSHTEYTPHMYGIADVVFSPGGGPSAPIVTNSTGASNITATSARLNGEVTSTGGEDPTVHIYWGDNNGGTTPADWDHDENLGTKGAGTFYKDISGLNPSTTYYYRAYATNSGGSDWADSTSSFTTGATTLPSGTITAPSSASPGQNFTLTLEGTDDIGVKRLDLYFGGSWHLYSCSGGAYCSHSWTHQESAAGTYRYFGNVWDSTNNASSWVCNGAASESCDSNCKGLGYIIGQNYSSATYCGANQCLCYRENPLSAGVTIQ